MTHAMLTWYAADVLDAASAHLALDPAFETDPDMTFRDDDGTWWRPRGDGAWMRHSEARGWEQASRPSALEGVAPLPVGVDVRRRRPTGDSPEERRAPADPWTAMERCVARVRRSYRAGQVVSTMAELYLADRMLLTGDGRIWAVGVQSGSWYVHDRQGWTRTDGPPDEAVLARPDADAVARRPDSPSRHWLDEGLGLPEPIAHDWSPPPPPDRPPALPPIDEPPPPRADVEVRRPAR